MSVELSTPILFYQRKPIQAPPRTKKRASYEGTRCYSSNQLSGFFHKAFHRPPSPGELEDLCNQYIRKLTGRARDWTVPANGDPLSASTITHPAQQRSAPPVRVSGTVLFYYDDRPIIASDSAIKQVFHLGIPCYSRLQISHFFHNAFDCFPTDSKLDTLWSFYTGTIQPERPAPEQNGVPTASASTPTDGSEERKKPPEATSAAAPKRAQPRQRRSRPQPTCWYYNKPGGCRRGSSCRFTHEKISSSREASRGAVPDTSQRREASARKTATKVDKVCRNFYHTGTCRFSEDRCGYIHVDRWTIDFCKGSRGQKLSVPPPPRRY